MMRITSLSAAAVLGISCVAAQPVLAPLVGDDVTLFVHGYKGSFLKTTGGNLAWLSASQALSPGEKSLALPFEGQRDLPAFGPLMVAGPLTKFTVLPLVVEETLYLPFMEFGRDHLPGFQVFAYDWRQDIRESGARLCARIESLGPARRVRIVAHSMGGLVTLSCLQHGPEAVRHAVTHVAFAGVPFQGAAGAWDDLFLGTVNARNSALMAAHALLTFSSTWELLPPRANFFVDEQRAPVEVAAFDSEQWLTRGWGVFSDATLRDDPAYRAQLGARLDAHRAFWSGLKDQQGGFKAMSFVGSGRATTAAFVARSDGSFDFSQSVTADGDGTVLVTSATPPAAFASSIVETRAEHAAMLNDPAVQAAIREFVR